MTGHTDPGSFGEKNNQLSQTGLGITLQETSHCRWCTYLRKAATFTWSGLMDESRQAGVYLTDLMR